MTCRCKCPENKKILSTIQNHIWYGIDRKCIILYQKIVSKQLNILKSAPLWCILKQTFICKLIAIQIYLSSQFDLHSMTWSEMYVFFCDAMKHPQASTLLKVPVVHINYVLPGYTQSSELNKENWNKNIKIKNSFGKEM